MIPLCLDQIAERPIYLVQGYDYPSARLVSFRFGHSHRVGLSRWTNVRGDTCVYISAVAPYENQTRIINQSLFLRKPNPNYPSTIDNPTPPPETTSSHCYFPHSNSYRSCPLSTDVRGDKFVSISAVAPSTKSGSELSIQATPSPTLSLLQRILGHSRIVYFVLHNNRWRVQTSDHRMRP